MKPCPFVDPTPNGLVLIHGINADRTQDLCLPPDVARFFADLIVKAAERAEALSASPPGSTTNPSPSPSERSRPH